MGLKESPGEIPPCAELDMGPDMPADLQQVLCGACGTEIDEAIACGVETATTEEEFLACTGCFDKEEEEADEEKEEEEGEDYPVEVWCPYVQGMDEVKDACREGEQCVIDNCGPCAPKMDSIYTCVVNNFLEGCDICANAAEALFEIA